LSLPLFCWLYLAIAAAETVAQTEVAVDIFGSEQAIERSQLLYVASLGSAIVNLNAVPATWRLGSS
jgi:hypothetical protein